MLALWSLLVGGSLAWNLSNLHQETQELALHAARSSIQKDLAFRQWGASHGGVYVPVSEQTPPNPYLTHVPERDIETPSGKRLTLMNPAYMLRQMMTQQAELYGPRGRLTSLRPLNPDNAPDAWETEALQSFERGARERVDITLLEDTPYLRVMQPLLTLPECLKCHKHQGYRAGDIRGGIGVRLALRSYWQAEARARKTFLLSHGIIWLLGLGIILLLIRRGRREFQRRLEAEHRSEALLMSTSEGIYGVDLDGNCTFANRACLDLLGYAQSEDLVGRNIHALISHTRADGAPYPSTDCRILQAARDERPLRMDDDILWRSDGSSFPVQYSSAPVRMWGRVVGLVVTFSDITARKQAEASLRRSELSYRRLMEQASDAILVSDANSGVILEANRKAAGLLGRPEGEIVGLTQNSLHPPAHRERYQSLFRDAVLGRESPFKDIFLVHRDGHQIPVEVHMALVDLGDSRVVQGIFRDITRRQEQEQALRASLVLVREHEIHLQSILDHALDAIVALDETGRITSCNPAAQTLFGFTPEEVLGRDLGQLILPPEFLTTGRWPFSVGRTDTVPEHRPGFQKRFEITARNKSGSSIELEVGLAAVQQAGQRHYTAFLRDITERKRLLESLRETLEVAESANRAKSEFLANMSHEIRSPMNAIIGMTDLVLNVPMTPEEQRRHLETVQQSSNSLLEIINGILDYSKIEAGQMILERIPMDVGQQVADACRSLALKAHLKELELYIHIGPEVPERVIGDPTRLRQVIVNLLNNAIKFTEAGEVTVRVERDATPSGDGSVLLRFSVIDTGIGIPPDRIGCIFDSFTQADGSTTRHYGGTGLGLTICKRLVRMMQGEIDVHSQPGGGSAFHFSARFRADPDAPAAPARTTETPLDGLAALVCHGQASGRQWLAETLGAWGARVRTVGDLTALPAALDEAAAAEDPWAVLIIDHSVLQDVALPPALRDPHPGCRNRPLILLPVHLTADTLSTLGWRQPFIALPKPLCRSPLREAIEQSLGRKPDHSPPQRPSRGLHATVPVHPLRILVAEDQDNNRTLARTILEKTGHQVWVAHNGQEALTLWERQPFDLILMDLQMPLMDGFEATRRIRGAIPGPGPGADPRVPILAVTGRVLQEEDRRCLECGMNDFLRKPYHPEELLRAIDPFIIRDQPPLPMVRKKTVPLEPVAVDPDTLAERIRRFADQIQNRLAELDKALGNHRGRPALQAANRIGDLAREIGARQVAVAALRLRGHAEMEDWETCASILTALRQAVDQVSIAMDGSSLPPPATDQGRLPAATVTLSPADRERLRDLLERLREALEVHSLSLTPLLDALEPLLATTPHTLELLQGLTEHADRYRFDQALRNLDRIVSICTGIAEE